MSNRELVTCDQCKQYKRYTIGYNDKWICCDCYEHNRKLSDYVQNRLFK